MKSFVGASVLNDLENAIGQYTLYGKLLAQQDRGRLLYLAVPEKAFSGVFSEPIGNIFLIDKDIRLIVFDIEKEEILRWIA